MKEGKGESQKREMGFGGSDPFTKIIPLFCLLFINDIADEKNPSSLLDSLTFSFLFSLLGSKVFLLLQASCCFSNAYNNLELKICAEILALDNFFL